MYTVAAFEEIVQRKFTFSFFRATFAHREQSTEARVGGTIGWPRNYCRRIGKDQLHAHHESQPHFFGCFVHPNHAGEGIDIRDPDGAISHKGSGVDKFIGVGSPPQK